ncbi:hypothetical protein HDU81_004025 [Chytriomyces hyalinus]|nr:hypothetical protein HDU81_004025 [Chytriomyces hyalinus]
MHVPIPRPDTASKTVLTPERRHYLDKSGNEREGKLFKEDLTNTASHSTTYNGDYGVHHFNLDASFQEPRFVKPKFNANVIITDKKKTVSPTQAEVDKFLYMSLYQSAFDPTGKGSPFKHLEKKTRVPGKTKATSLYQDTYANPRDNRNEIKLLDNKSNRTGIVRQEPPPASEVSTLLHLVKGSCKETSYNHDFHNAEGIVESGEAPSFASIVTKAFKYRR